MDKEDNNVSNQPFKVVTKTEETELLKQATAMDPKEQVKLNNECLGVNDSVNVIALKTVDTELLKEAIAEEPEDYIKFIKECLGVNDSVNVLCDESFIKWVVRKEKDPCPFIKEACRVELGAELKTTKHAYQSLLTYTCIKGVLTNPEYNDCFLATTSKSLYKSIKNTLPTPIITLTAEENITVLPPIASQKELFEARRLGLVQQVAECFEGEDEEFVNLEDEEEEDDPFDKKESEKDDLFVLECHKAKLHEYKDKPEIFGYDSLKEASSGSDSLDSSEEEAEPW